jgi:hypothetical protein
MGGFEPPGSGHFGVPSFLSYPLNIYRISFPGITTLSLYSLHAYNLMQEHGFMALFNLRKPLPPEEFDPD